MSETQKDVGIMRWKHMKCNSVESPKRDFLHKSGKYRHFITQGKRTVSSKIGTKHVHVQEEA